MKRNYLEEGSKVKINLNYLKEFLNPGEFEAEKQYNSIGVVTRVCFVEDIDFYEVLWDDGKTEQGFNKELLQEIYDIDVLMKELL